ncbi:hypothetical protein RhiirA1_472306 [Rhizophagus irregularis]|uniref:Uncharacterized protein n=1 Tax=Rhizophagus irregularis TaxID=588596 RepID=A0A2N0R2M2_9GLOM|nr:hypothetical protein RhiirA1_472306 [Rhizophagus irregularis]
MKEKNFTGPNNCEIRFSAAMYFRSKKLVNYHITETELSDQIRPPTDLSDTESQPRTDDISYQIVQSVEQSLPNSQYALYDNNEGFYIVKMHTPGFIFEDNDFTVIETNLQTKFKVDIVFPRMINTDHPIRANVEHGVTMAMFNIKLNKRKLQII